jgi:hypothetical protein
MHGESISTSAKPEFKTILCCNKLKILDYPPFQNPFGHPERKLHYLCIHWSGRKAVPDRKENEGLALDKHGVSSKSSRMMGKMSA